MVKLYNKKNFKDRQKIYMEVNYKNSDDYRERSPSIGNTLRKKDKEREVF
ncbi:hypothetical protein [Anaerophilus nitritogenes]|nr:hypothetical protein [Anaerophilus nitritogenes]